MRWKADLVTWELVDASAITVVEPTMFAMGRGFAVPGEGEVSATEGVEMAESGVFAGYMPAHHDSMPAQQDKSSRPQPAHDDIPLLANLDQLAVRPSHREEWEGGARFRWWDVYDNHPD